MNSSNLPGSETSFATAELADQLAENYIDPQVYNPYHKEHGNGHTEPNGEVGNESDASMAPPVPISIPVGPFIPVLPRLYSARYRGRTTFWELELRVDVDGTRRTNKVSGDFYMLSGLTKTYWGSFIINSPSIVFGATNVIIEGYWAATSPLGPPYLRITVPKTTIFQPAPNAIMSFLPGPLGPVGVTYTCAYESWALRSVSYEQDYVSGVTPFVSYNIGSLTSGGPARTLSVSRAYAEASVQMNNTGGTNIVPVGAIGASWSNAELHNAMVNNFSGWADQTDWRVWLLEAILHDYGSGLYGIMFDQQGKQRQGCAVFHASIGGASATQQRWQLYTYIHELGHCFNLLHSWQKSLGSPPVPNRNTSLSWMNYPFNTSAFPTMAHFWNNFAFQFDTEELIHLRHAYRNNIIMGGNNFTVGSALEHSHSDLFDFETPIEDNTCLALRIETKKSFSLGEPVVVDLKLSTHDMRGKIVNARLHPNFDYLKIAIKKPNGEVFVYEPLIEHLASPDNVALTQESPAVYESAYIGFGKRGFYFDQSGFYTLKAVYFDNNNNKIVSNEVKLRVKPSVSIEDDEIAELYLGEEQGYLFYLLGSDSMHLKNGNAAFDLVLDKHGKHPLSAYAALAKGINASRNFKNIESDKTLTVRAGNTKLNEKLINHVVNLSKGKEGVDNITLNMAMRNYAKSQVEDGNVEKAKQIMDNMVSIFQAKGLKSAVMTEIKKEAQLPFV